MDWPTALALGALQGVTEFLPVSSSGHLVLAQHYLGFTEQHRATAASLFLDGLLHLGTLLAVLAFFRRDLYRAVSAAGGDRHKLVIAGTRLLGLLVVASLPAALTTLALSDHIQSTFENPVMVATSFLALGVLLSLTDRLPERDTEFHNMRLWQALLIGLAQALSALIRGLSRSGMTIAGGLAVGLVRGWAVRFSFLMSIVANCGLGSLGVYKAWRDPHVHEWLTGEFLLLALVATATSAVVGYLTMAPLVGLVRRARMSYFACYLWLVGAAVLAERAIHLGK